MSSLTVEPDAAIPSWDGSNRAWRRYCKEVGWLVGATKSSQRRYIASKLISRLTGSARLLAMSWSQREFDGEQGVASIGIIAIGSALIAYCCSNHVRVLFFS